MARVLQTGKSEYNIGLESIKHVSVISDRMPLWRDGKVEGVIAIFRNGPRSRAGAGFDPACCT